MGENVGYYGGTVLKSLVRDVRDLLNNIGQGVSSKHVAEITYLRLSVCRWVRCSRFVRKWESFHASGVAD